MVQIFVQHAYSDCRELYDIFPSETVQGLKQEIEETEGVVADKQMLFLNDEELSSLDELVEGTTVTLFIVASITIKPKDGGATFTIRMSLEHRTVLSLVERILDLGYPYDDPRYFGLELDGQPLAKTKTLESYNISDGTIIIVWADTGRRFQSAFERPSPSLAIVEACFDWDGDMKHPKVTGLPLTKGTAVDVLYVAAPGWCYGKYDQKKSKREGLFPRKYVQIKRIIHWGFKAELGQDDPTLIPRDIVVHSSEGPNHSGGARWISKLSRMVFEPAIPSQSTEAAVASQPTQAQEPACPPLPDFPYPAPEPVSLRVNLGDKGASFVQVELSHIKTSSSLNERPSVEVTLKCLPISPRRITSVVLSLTFEGNDVGDIEPRQVLGPQTRTDIERVDHQSTSLSGGVSHDFLNVGAQWSRGNDTKAVATRETQMKIESLVVGRDTVRWTLMEDVGEGGRHGLPQEVKMSFTLRYRPPKMKYVCHVAHERNEAVQRARRIDGTRDLY